ncbi:glyoxalase superfamily protein [Silvimonas iriomotensis]|uniref:VOC domain-containing protein n=1 Tax=Silvimonas iriomotensis TaxID=449662 RepID=A0ABQ2P4A6_9NEIS|nr:glyoxalase superfamily protein [Silvimonas iriomotensis]GGP17863.1 hypothetical protein GCM10010970_01930 [Silvimonas iriomotensis]
MTSAIPHPVHFGRIAPTLPVADMDRAIAFYTQVLGFTKAFENGNPVGFVILKKDNAELHLTLDKQHKAVPRNVAHLLVHDAAALYQHLQQHNVRVIKALRDADFGMRCFVFADPDGNRIDVGENR